MKLNAPIPSSVPVERLFRQASLVLAARRSLLSNYLLKILILLKIRKKTDLICGIIAIS